MKNRLFGIVRAAALAGMACIPAAALGQDAVKTAPDIYKVAVENAWIERSTSGFRPEEGRRCTRTRRRS